MTKRLKTQAALLALTVASFAATTDADTGVTTYALPVLPAGTSSLPVDNRFKGQAVLHDNAAIAATFNSKGRKVPVDIGHLTVYDSAAPAFGWVVGLFVAEDGSLWATCELTTEGAALVDGKRFGYTSPTLSGAYVDTGDWMAFNLKSLALTNSPALEMDAVFSAEGEDDTDDEPDAPQVPVAETPTDPDQPAEGAPAPEQTTTLAAVPPALETVALADFTALQGTVVALTAERDAARADVTSLTARADALAAEVQALTASRDTALADLAAFNAAKQTAAVQAAIDAANVAGKAFPFERDVLTAYAAAHGVDKLTAYLAARPGSAPFNPAAGGTEDFSDSAEVLSQREYLRSIGMTPAF